MTKVNLIMCPWSDDRMTSTYRKKKSKRKIENKKNKNLKFKIH